jgi:hypothetical protein
VADHEVSDDHREENQGRHAVEAEAGIGRATGETADGIAPTAVEAVAAEG